MKERVKSRMKLNFIISVILFSSIGAAFEDCKMSMDFQCGDGECLPKNQQCDRIINCKDASDERNCGDYSCPGPKFWRCNSGLCIESLSKCNSEPDCPDGSDEHLCPEEVIQDSFPSKCSPDEFECGDGSCLPNDSVCNGFNDCYDNSDEYNCSTNTTCKDFLCNDGHCLIKEFVCDGEKDCKDGSDEINCNKSIKDDDCTVENGFYLCKDKSKCLSLTKLCNSEQDCGDGSDEGGFCNNAQRNCENTNCSHSCMNTPQGHYCVCPDGYLKANHHTCEDLDECSLLHNNCSQHCENHPGSYKCYCEDGFELDKNGHSCKTKDGDGILFYSTSKSIKAFHIKAEKLQVLAKVNTKPMGLLYDGESIYWSSISFGRETISRSPLKKIVPEIIVNNGLGLVEDIALDWLTGNIYFTDNELKQIAVCTNDGSHCSVLIAKNVHKPRAIALHPVNGQMYWSDWGTKANISRASMDGSDIVEFINTNIVWPNGVCIDYPNDKLYWVDAFLHSIESINLDGKNRKKIMEYSHHPYNIAIFEDSLYWSDWKTRNIQRCNKFNGKNHEIVMDSTSTYGFHIFHPAYETKKNHSCMSTPCEYICLLRGNNSYSCGCPVDKVLALDGHSCKDSLEKHELIAGFGNSLVQIHHQRVGRTILEETKLEVSDINCLVYDSQHDSVILYDFIENVILSVSDLDKSPPKTTTLVNEGIDFITRLEIDEFTNNLYWSDKNMKTVEVLSLNNNHRATIIRQSQSQTPIDLALAPKRGFMFVAFQSPNEDIHISRISMDGTGPRIIILSSGLFGDGFYMFAEEATQMLYIASSNIKSIETVNFDGTQRKQFWVLQSPAESLTILGAYMFWTEARSPYLYWIEKNAPDQKYPKRLKLDPSDKSRVRIASAVFQRKKYSTLKHPCAMPNNPCSHICVQTENANVTEVDFLFHNNMHYNCLCPNHLIRGSDEHSCKVPVHCDENQFLCFKSNLCIDLDRECDGKIDCPEHEDELKCEDHSKHCASNEFQCNNGECVPIKYRCDKHYDCFDLTDEKNCTGYVHQEKEKCSKTDFECRNEECIPMSLVCDGKSDCEGGDDEEHCQEMTCENNEFRCDSGKCIDKSLECDSEKDCPDGSDEHEHCHPVTHCTHKMFHCRNGRCVDIKLHCDRYDDCGDYSDEQNCPENDHNEVQKCEKGEFQCPSDKNMCIPEKSRCNGIPDCIGAEDEADCHHPSCRPGVEFGCKNGQCIPIEFACDKQVDCVDHSDESTDVCDVVKGEISHKDLLQTDVKFAQHNCETGYRCSNGQCIEYKFLCNGVPNCLDGSDEGGACNTSCHDSVCSHTCIKSPKGAICLCPQYRELAPDGRTCVVPPPPCSTEKNLCHHICVNMKKYDYVCKCHEGFVLREDGRSCKALGEPVSIIFHANGDIRKMTLRNNTIKVVHKDSTPKITGLDVYSKANAVFYSVAELGQLHHLNMTSNTENIVYQLGQPTLLTVDWVTENVYFVDESQKRIVVCHMDKQKCANLIELDHDTTVTAFVVDPINRFMFYTLLSWHVPGHQISIIHKANLDGNDVTEILKDDKISCSGLTLDYDKRILYFSDQKSNTIESINYEGTHRITVFEKNPFIFKPSHLDTFEEDIFISSSFTNKITRCKLTENKKCKSFTLHSLGTNFFKIHQISKQRAIENPCANLNCSHLCVMSPRKPICICENGLSDIFYGECSKPKNFIQPIFPKKISSQDDNRVMRKATGTGFIVMIFVGLVIALMGLTILIYVKCNQKIKKQLANLNYSVHFHNGGFRGGLPLFNSNITSTQKCPTIVKPQEYENPLNSKIDNTNWFLSAPDAKHIETIHKISGCQLQVPNILADSDSDVESDRDFHDSEKAKLIS